MPLTVGSSVSQVTLTWPLQGICPQWLIAIVSASERATLPTAKRALSTAAFPVVSLTEKPVSPAWKTCPRAGVVAGEAATE